MNYCNSEKAAIEGLTGPIWATETQDLDCTLLNWTPGHQIAEHVNSEVDVVMTVLEGTGQLEIDGDELDLKSGMIAVIPKGASRRLIAGPTGLMYTNVHQRRRRLHPLGDSPRR